jgi:hypothetical protein
MFRFIFFSFLAGLFGWSRPVYIHNDVTVENDYVAEDCGCDFDGDGGDSSGD